jgi:hypothetical protein
MRKQDRIQQQKDQDQSRHSGEPQSKEQVKGSAPEAQQRPPREPGKPLPLPE